MNQQNNLFLLMFNLSQMNEKVKIMNLFLESINELFGPCKFFYSENKPEQAYYFEEIILKDISYGYIEYSGSPPEETIGSLQNAIQMLALILDRLRMDQELKHKAKSLESVAKQRLDAIRANVEELENSKRESLALIENLKKEISRREKIENELSVSEEKFRLSFHTSPDAISINRLEDGTYIDINQGFTEISGYTADEIVGKTSYDIDIWVDFNLREKLIQEVKKNGKFYNLQAKFRAKDGHIIDGLMSASLFNLNNVPHFINITRDISEIKKIAELVRKERDQAQKYLDVAGVMFATLNKKGEITLINKKGCEIMGYDKAEDLIGKNWLEVCLPKHIKKEVKDVFREQMEGNIKAYEYYENPIITKSGENRIIAFHNTILRDSEGNITGVLFSGEDITDREKTKKSLLEIQDQLSTIYNTVGVIIYYLKVEGKGKYRFVSVNEMFCNTTGLTMDQIIDKDVSEVIPEPSLSLVLSNYKKAIKEKSIVRWEEVTLYPKGNKTGEVSIAPVFDQQGNCTHLVGSVHDITELKKAEKEIKTLNSDLEKRVEERTAELEKANKELEEVNDVFVGREMRIIELKEEVERLKNKLKE